MLKQDIHNLSKSDHENIMIMMLMIMMVMEEQTFFPQLWFRVLLNFRLHCCTHCAIIKTRSYKMGMGGISTLPYRRSCLTDVRKIVKLEWLHRSVGGAKGFRAHHRSRGTYDGRQFLGLEAHRCVHQIPLHVDSQTQRQNAFLLLAQRSPSRTKQGWD